MFFYCFLYIYFNGFYQLLYPTMCLNYAVNKIVSIMIDEAILNWVTAARNKMFPLSETLIREKSKQFAAAALGRDHFSVSIGSLDNFKKGMVC